MLAAKEQQVVDLFQNTTITLEDGRYEVRLAKKEGASPLGETRSIAERCLIQNERSLQRKNKLAHFQKQVNDNGKRGHVEFVPIENMSKPNSEVANMPLHGVEKSTSSTTKLRVVSGASAKSSIGVSLNDTLLPGPSRPPYYYSFELTI